MTSTSDIQWSNLFKRIRHAAPSTGQAIIQITVRTRDGQAVEWLEPLVKKVEPKVSLLEAIGGKQE